MSHEIPILFEYDDGYSSDSSWEKYVNNDDETHDRLYGRINNQLRNYGENNNIQ